jgi:hypothetical protein
MKEGGGSGSLMVVVGGWIDFCVITGGLGFSEKNGTWSEEMIERGQVGVNSLFHFDVRCWEFDVRRSRNS